MKTSFKESGEENKDTRQQVPEKVFTIDDLSEEERNIVHAVLVGWPTTETWLDHLDELNIEERRCYFEQLAQQPELEKMAAEYEKKGVKVTKGTVYDFDIENGNKSSLEPSSIS